MVWDSQFPTKRIPKYQGRTWKYKPVTDLKPSPSFLPIWMVIKLVSHLYVGSSSWVLRYRARNTVSQRADPMDYLQLSLSQQGEPHHRTAQAQCGQTHAGTHRVALHYHSHWKDPQVFLPSICSTLPSAPCAHNRNSSHRWPVEQQYNTACTWTRPSPTSIWPPD